MPRNVRHYGHSKRIGDRNFKRMKSNVYYHGIRKQDKHKSWKNY